MKIIWEEEDIWISRTIHASDGNFFTLVEISGLVPEKKYGILDRQGNVIEFYRKKDLADYMTTRKFIS